MVDEPAAGWLLIRLRVPHRNVTADREGYRHSEVRWEACPLAVKQIPGIPHPMVQTFRHRHEAVKFTHDQMAPFGWCRRRRGFCA